jgi:hypothetical protein
VGDGPKGVMWPWLGWFGWAWGPFFFNICHALFLSNFYLFIYFCFIKPFFKLKFKTSFKHIKILGFCFFLIKEKEAAFVNPIA